MKTKYAAWVIGTGIMLMAIHNRLLTLTDSNNVTWLFLPQLGLECAMFITLLYAMFMYKKLSLGSKFIWIPLAVICGSIVISEIWQLVLGAPVMDALTKMILGVFLFVLYMVARKMGEELFKPFTIAVIVVSISCVVYGIMNHGIKNGGLASPTNYDMAAGLMIIGTVVSVVKRQWWLWPITLIGLFFTGAEEGIFGVTVLLITMLIRRDFGWKMLLPISVMVITISLLFAFGYAQKLYKPTVERITTVQNIVIGESNDVKKELNAASGYRLFGNWSLSPIKPFGYGYNINDFYTRIQHNVALIIIEQIGILAALAWVFVVFYCLIKTKWKYAFISVLALGVFDHYLWTMWFPVVPALIGMATASDIKSDLIFKNTDSKKAEVVKCPKQYIAENAVKP